MSREAIIDRVRDVAQPILDSLGLELVDVFYFSGRGKGMLRIFIDKREGVTLGDCEQVSNYLGRALDVQDPIPVAYTLEVSSPGLDRPLKRKEDYQQSLGKLVRIKTLQPIDRGSLFVGRLNSVTESSIEVVLANQKVLSIPFETIASARLEIEF